MVLREHNDPLNQSRGIMGPLENSTGINVQNNRGRLRQRFDLIRKLGQGTYGKVQLGIDKETGQEVAIKTIKKSKIETEADLIRIRREIQIMSSVRHPNIIHIYEVFENREKMVLVMEYAAGGELYDYLNERKILQEDEARRIFRQIASAVYYCHKHKICHRDLKLENILLDEQSNAKIADFGLSNVFDDVHLLKTFCGSPLYASPEIVKGTPYFGPEVDCWSLGVLLYTLVYGAMPFDGSNFKRLVKQISNGDYYEPKKPAEASSLIRIMLTVDPLTRATIKDVCSHAWINQSFQTACLGIAEDLANATPVRLDLLLSLAPAYDINHSQVVIESPGGDGGAAAPLTATVAAAAAAAAPTTSNANHEKLKKGEGKEKAGEVPAKPKRKQQQVKSKSKSSPLLELIMDEEDEAEGDNDDEGDTLSEISEIQTIAEDLNDVKEKCKLKESKDKLQKPKICTVAKPEKAAENTGTSNKPKVVDLEKKTEPAVAKVEVKPSDKFTVKKVVEKKEETPPVEKKAEEKAVVETPKTPVVKKKVVKPKPAEVLPPPPTAPVPPSPIGADTLALVIPNEEKVAKKEEKLAKKEEVAKKEEIDKKEEDVQKEEPAKKEEEVKNEEKVPQKKDEKGPMKKETTPAPEPAFKEDISTDSEKEGGTSSRPKLIKQRSDSSSEVSPTRIERRNSKVISQKTAELIQNLNTKTSTNSTSEPAPKPVKKLIIPSFKVSDAKSRFETKPPRPVNASSTLSKSKAAIEAKFSQQQSVDKDDVKKVVKAAEKKDEEKDKIPEPKAEEATKKRKSKSPSPRKEAETEADTGNKEVPKTISNSLEATSGETAAARSPTSSPKQKPKLTKKVAVEKEEPKRDLLQSPEPSTLSEDTSAKTSTDDASTVSQATTAPTVTDIVIKSTKVVPPKPAKVADQQVKSVVVDTGSGAKPAMMLIKGKTSTLPFQKSPPETASSTSTPEPATDEKKPKLLTKLPPQNKEQAAKKISSVITKIVTSGSADKGLNEDKKFSTLPRNAKLSKQPETPASGQIKTEVVASVGENGKPKIQKTEVSFPVAAAASQERIIPIKLTDDTVAAAGGVSSGNSSRNTSTTQIPRLPPRIDSFKRMDSANSTFSRQNSSDTESSMAMPAPKPETIKKSPREFLIPIKLEASGQTVVPKEDIAAEASTAGSASSLAEDDFRMDSRLRSGRFGRQKRYSSLLSDSSLDDEPSVSASTSRRSSAVGGAALPPAHARSRSQGDEPDTSTAGGSFKRYRMRRSDMPLDRSDSFSSAEEDEEDAFEVLTAESLFSNLLDRVRNLTRRLNREDSVGPSWASSGSDPPGFALWGNTPLREFMARAPSESRSYTSTTPGTYSMSHRAFSREPSVTVTINPGPGAWRRSLSRELSGDSDSASATSHNAHSRSIGGLGGRRISDIGGDSTTVRSLPMSLSHGRRSSPSFYSQRSESGDSSISSSAAGYHPPMGRTYSRTMSNMDYSSPLSTHTLPFHRRSLKNYDRSGYGERDYSNGSIAMSPQVDAMVGAVRGIASRIEPSLSYTPNGTSYLSRMRSISRETPDRERSIGPSLYSSSKNDMGPGISSGECNGWVGGSNSSLATSNSNGSNSKLSVQEKMNNYQQFYHSLSNNINPEMRRFQLLNPSHQVHTNVSVRPNTMYETSFINNDPIDQGEMEKQPEVSQLSPPIVSPKESSPATENPPVIATIKPHPVQKQVVADVPAPKEESIVTPPTSTSPTILPSSSIPKWPNVSIKQHRPLSISSFPSNSERPKPVARVTSPPPESSPTVTNNVVEKPITSNPCPSTPKLKREVRATSVERITRFLERKSAPREIPPSVDSKPANKDSESETAAESLASTEKGKSSKTSSKPKFLQSLEKKWEKLKTGNSKDKDDSSVTAGQDANISPRDSPVPQHDTPEPPGSEDSLTEENNVKQGSESVLLQRAVSPEKKPKSKFGASTVNFMLGKFRKFEENTSPLNASNNSFSRIPSGKPPSGNSSSRIGRRVQSVYAGAISDSVLSLPKENKQLVPSTPKTEPKVQQPETISETEKSEVCNGHTEHETVSNINTIKDDAVELIKSAEAAQMKRRSFMTQPSTPMVASTTPIKVATPEKIESTSVETPAPPVENKPRRPHSLGIFSSDSSKNSTSFIPRFQRQSADVTNGDALSPVDKLIPKQSSPLVLPEILIEESMSSRISAENGDDTALSPLTPTSVSDSYDSSSVCSERTEQSMIRSTSVLDEEESVSDRIFRKSFYNRFNSLDRKKSTSSSSAGHKLTSPSPSRQGSINGNHKRDKINSSATSGIASSGTNTSGGVSSASAGSGHRSPSPNLLISKYNPNPLFKELITDDYKSNVGRKAEYSRRVTSKLSKLLREIDTDIKSCNLKDSPALNGFSSKEGHNNLVNHHKAIHNTENGCHDVNIGSENGNDDENGLMSEK